MPVLVQLVLLYPTILLVIMTILAMIMIKDK